MSSVPIAPLAPQERAYARASRADVLAVAGMWIGVVAGIMLKFSFGGWMVLAIMLYSPLILGLPVLGASLLNHALVGHSSTRRRYGFAPRRFRVAAWTIGAGILVAGSTLPDGGDDDAGTSAVTALLGIGAPSDAWANLAITGWWAAAIASVLVIGWVVSDRRSRRRAAR